MPRNVKIQHQTNPKGNKFWQLKKIFCFDEIDQLIKKGVYIPEIARLMQEDHKVFLHMKRSSLEAYLLSYRRTIPKAELDSRVNATLVRNLEKAAIKQINVLEEYSKLYAMQIKRIERAVEQEDTMGLNMNQLEVSFKTAQSILDSIHNVQSDLGITPKHLGTLDIESNSIANAVNKYADANVTKVLENAVSRHKVLNVAERILALAAENKHENTNLNRLTDLLDGRIIDVEPINVEEVVEVTR